MAVVIDGTSGITTPSVDSTGQSTFTGALALPAGGLNVGSGQLAVDASGRVTMSAQPSVGVYMSGNQSISTATPTKVAFNVIDYERGSNFNTSTNRFTAPVAGVYLVQAHVYIYTVNQAEVHIYKNGTVFIRCAGAGVSSTNPNGYQANHILNLTAGDYVEIIGVQTNGNTQTIYSGSSRESYLTIAMLN